MPHRYVAMSLLSLIIGVASVGCSGPTSSPSAPSSIQATAGSVSLGSPAVHTAAAAKVITTSVQVPFAASAFADWTSEWVELSGRIHIVSQVTPLPICLSGAPCLSVTLHTNLDGIKGVGLTTRRPYSVELVKSQLSPVEVAIGDILNDIRSIRLREQGVKQSIEESQDYDLLITANVNAAAESYAAILCSLFCNDGIGQ
jgi:hypothetical protein